jgi:hypothetical protein
LNPPPKNLIVEVISGPPGVELKSYVVEFGTARTFGGVRRSASKDVTGISDRTMSCPHFRITNMGGEITLLDCESLNGTKINGHKVREETIAEETSFQAGRTRFQVRWEKRADDSEHKLNPFDPNYIAPTQDIPDPPKTEDNSSVNSSGPLGSSSFNPFESSVVDAPSSLFRKPESSLSGLINPVDQAVDQPDDTAGSLSDMSGIDPVVRLIKRTKTPGSEFEKTIRHLADHFDFFAIAHLAKLNVASVQSRTHIPLFPHLDPHGSAFPVAIRKNDWLGKLHDELAERLVALDGLLIVICRPQGDEQEKGLLEMGSAALPGFSEQGGFIPWCWPSSATCVLESMSDAMIAKWMGSSLAGLVLPQPDRIVAFTSRETSEIFFNQGFC